MKWSGSCLSCRRGKRSFARKLQCCQICSEPFSRQRRLSAAKINASAAPAHHPLPTREKASKLLKSLGKVIQPRQTWMFSVPELTLSIVSTSLRVRDVRLNWTSRLHSSTSVQDAGRILAPTLELTCAEGQIGLTVARHDASNEF